MSYKYYNANALGKFSEDCTVRSISCATGKSWDYVYDTLSDEAQKQGTMMDSSKFIQDYLDERYERIPYINGTVGEISGKFSNHILLITMRNHIVCSRYGVIYDTFDCRNREAEYVWIVK